MTGPIAHPSVRLYVLATSAWVVTCHRAAGPRARVAARDHAGHVQAADVDVHLLLGLDRRRALTHLSAARLEHLDSRLADFPTLRARAAAMRIETDRARAHLVSALDALESGSPQTMLLVLEFTPRHWTWWLAAFLLFRLFDIWKPFPIRQCDARLKGGFGVMFDDLLAALYAIATLKALQWLMMTA